MSGVEFVGYPAISALVAAALGKSEMRLQDRHSRDFSNASFTGGVLWDPAEKMAVNGDIEGARRLAPAVLKTASDIVTSAARLDPVYRLDEGRWIDVARFVKGEPECWGDMVESEPTLRRRGLSVLINTGVSSNVSAQAVDKVGAQIGGAVLGLQAMGNSVTLHFVKNWGAYVNRNRRLVFHAPVNPGGAILDTAMLAAICASWFHRRIMFSLLETMNAETRREFGAGYAYGHAEPLGLTDAKKIAGTDRVVIVNVLDHVRNPQGVKDAILRQNQEGIK